MYSIRLDFWISYLAYFLGVWFLCHKYPVYKTAVVLSFVLTIIGIYGTLTVTVGLPMTLPNILSTIIACICGWLFNTVKQRVYKFAIIVFSICLCIYFVFWGIDVYDHYYYYRNFTGKTNQRVIPEWSSYIAVDSDFSAKYNDEKLILFDFYNTWCSVCIGKFPKFQDAYNRYKNYPNMLVYAVDIPWQNDTTGMALQMVRSRGYTFPVLIGKTGLDTILCITWYPTVILLKGNRIIYKGDIEQVDKYIIEEESKK
jgi:thiol-disulfide isomerase/thioredoxin